jgi:hypothetical protein
MARVKKERDAQIIHFSFFDLLFGAFGAFVFLMIMHVVSTMNMVDSDYKKMVDDLVKEKSTLTVQVAQLNAEIKNQVEFEKMYQEAQGNLSQINSEKKSLAIQTNKLQSQVMELQRENSSLKDQNEEFLKKGDLQKTLGRKNQQLTKDLAAANEKLAIFQAIPLKIKSFNLPPIFNGENIQIAVAAEGGIPPYSWDYQGNLPDGLVLNRENGLITGRTIKEGNFKFVFKLKDSTGKTVVSPKDISLMVVKRPINQKEVKTGVSKWFAVMAIIISLLLLYIMWSKYKSYRYCKEMEAKGYKPMWIKD